MHPLLEVAGRHGGMHRNGEVVVATLAIAPILSDHIAGGSEDRLSLNYIRRQQVSRSTRPT